MDIGASPAFRTYGVDEAKAVTRWHGGTGGPWISTKGRTTTPAELLRLQGFISDDAPWAQLGITRAKIGQLIGNALSVNTIGCVLEEALWSSGLVAKQVKFPRESHCL